MARTEGKRGKSLAKAALAKNNTTQFTIEGVYEDARQKFTNMASSLGISFNANNTVNNNAIKNDTASNTAHSGTTGNPHNTSISDITGLQGAIDNKQDAFTGYNGTVTVVTSVDFVGQTKTTQTLTVKNGVITGVN
jgi:hypothetical protein